MKDENALIEDLQQGDHSAMETLYRRYKTSLLHLLYRLHVDPHTSEDILHDVFLSFVTCIHGFQLRSSLRGYLSKSATNRVMDLARQHKRRHRLENRRQIDVQVDPARQVQNRELAHYARDCLSELPHNQYEVVTYRIYGGLTFSEIARIQCVTPNVARARHHRALKKIGLMLEKRQTSRLRDLP